MEKKITGKRHFVFLRMTAIMLVMVITFGVLPVSAKTKSTQEIPTVEVSSKKKLIKQLKTDREETIVFKTDKEVDISIPSTKYSSKKHIVIKAVNAHITNKAKFASDECTVYLFVIVK